MLFFQNKLPQLINFFFIILIFPPTFKIYGSQEKVSILFSGEELGSLEPCGCYEGQLGGISRRYTFINLLRKQNNIILPISLGDLPKNFGRQEEIKVEILSYALGEMGYVLHNLGEKDIEIGPQLLSYLSQTSKVILLSSNVEIISPFSPKINQYVLKEYSQDTKYPFKIAFLGIISESLLSSDVLEYTKISEPVKTLNALIPQLKDKVNLIVLLSHAPLEESIEIAELFPEIGLIITGHNINEPTDSMIYGNNTPIVSPGTGGKYIGIARYVINKTLERISMEVIPLDNKYKDSPEMTLLLKKYQQMLIDEDLISKIPQIPLPDNISYVGSSVCGICHKIVYNHWTKTTHGSSYRTLFNVRHQYDPECIKCHTTGYEYVSGFLNYEKNQNLINVGCESCHGPGSEHIKKVDITYGSVGENICETCHDSEHSPMFQFKEYWEKIIHPKEMLKN